MIPILKKFGFKGKEELANKIKNCLLVLYLMLSIVYLWSLNCTNEMVILVFTILFGATSFFLMNELVYDE